MPRCEGVTAIPVSYTHLKLALDIGSMILEEMPIQEILKQASHRNQYRYEFVKNRKKQDAILAVCETGIGTAEKISKLMEDSLPKTCLLYTSRCV